MNYIKSNGDLNITKLISHTIFLIIVLIFLFGSFGTIDAGQRGVTIRLGNVVGTKEPGLFFKLPILDKVKKFNTKTQTVEYERENPLTSASKDLQDVLVATVINYHLDPIYVGKIYSDYGDEETFSANVIRPAVRDTVKAMTSEFTAEELVTKRPQFTDKTFSTLSERLSDKYIVIERVNITDLQFSKSFTQLIEDKVKAEQDALTAKNKLEQIKYEAQQTIEKAKADAEAIKIQAQAINSQGGADYVNLQWINAWKEGGAQVPTTILGNGANFLYQLK